MAAGGPEEGAGSPYASGVAAAQGTRAGGVAGAELAHSLSRPVAGVMLTRLAVVAMAFGLALAVIGAGRDGAELAENGLYGTLALAFLASAVYAARFRHVRRLGRFAAAQLVTDIGTVTALVAFSGGAESLFSFLYLPVAVYGAILLGRQGAYAAALGCSAAYGMGIVLAPQLSGSLGGSQVPPTALALWCVHSGALLLVALLSSALVRELRLVGERLSESRDDLRALRNLHERTVACLTSGLLTTDPEGHITSFNPEAEHIVGRSERSVVGLPVDEVLPGAAALLEAAPAGRRLSLEIADAEGEARHLGVATSVLRDASGIPNGRVVIFQDVTSVVSMERELRRSERLAGVGQLAADIAHEVRNPLAAISGSVEMLMSTEGESRGERERLMDIVLREIERLDGLISDFLAYARPAPAKLEAVALEGLVEELVEMFSTTRPEGLELETRIPTGCSVQADPTQLRQILWNLLRNAAQALAGPGRIGIEALGMPGHPQAGPEDGRNAVEEGASTVEICVSDTGPGIPAEHLERVFDPFFTTKPDGTGLGLATVHRIVDAHDGSLQVESRPGEGTQVRVRLQAAASAEPAPREEPA